MFFLGDFFFKHIVQFFSKSGQCPLTSRSDQHIRLCGLLCECLFKMSSYLILAPSSGVTVKSKDIKYKCYRIHLESFLFCHSLCSCPGPHFCVGLRFRPRGTGTYRSTESLLLNFSLRGRVMRFGVEEVNKYRTMNQLC